MTAITIDSDAFSHRLPGCLCTTQYGFTGCPVPFTLVVARSNCFSKRCRLETALESSCSICKRPLPQPGALCPYCAEDSGPGFHVRPWLLALIVLISAVFGAATVFANRLYQSKQQKFGQMWFGRGEAALAAGQPQSAVQDFRNALYFSHDNPDYRLRLAEALLASRHIPEAQSYLITLWQDEPSNSTVNLQLARLAAQQRATQRALRYYHGAIYGLWPDGGAAARRRQTRLELIRYLLGLHETTQADAELIALIPELPRTAAPHVEVGQLLLQANDEERALQEFEEALRLDPRAPAALRGAGEAAFRLGQYQMASRYLEQALKSGARDPQAADLLASSRLVLEWNPYARGVSSRQRALRIVQAFRQARQRLGACSTARGIDLTAAAPAPPANANPLPPPPANTARTPAPNLMARILGRITPADTAPAQAPAAPSPAHMQQLYQQVAELQPRVRLYAIERDPQLADLAMGLAMQVENVTAQQCGTPTGPDLALLLLARQGALPQ